MSVEFEGRALFSVLSGQFGASAIVVDYDRETITAPPLTWVEWYPSIWTKFAWN